MIQIDSRNINYFLANKSQHHHANTSLMSLKRSYRVILMTFAELACYSMQQLELLLPLFTGTWWKSKKGWKKNCGWWLFGFQNNASKFLSISFNFFQFLSFGFIGESLGDGHIFQITEEVPCLHILISREGRRLERTYQTIVASDRECPPLAEWPTHGFTPN